MSDPIQPLTPAEASQTDANVEKENYIERLPRALDVFLNEATGGQMDETISSRMARWDTEETGIRHEVGKVVSEGLDLLQTDHGAKAEEADKKRAEDVVATENATGDIPK